MTHSGLWKERLIVSVLVSMVLNMEPATKRCGMCGETKPTEAFALSLRARDGRQGRCRSCYAAWYRENTVEHLAAVRRRKTAHLAAVREELVAFLRNHPCV